MNVYFLHHARLPIIKIGKANDVQARIKGLGRSFFTGTAWFYETTSEARSRELERIFHTIYRRFWLTNPTDVPDSGSSEWFSIKCLADHDLLAKGLISSLKLGRSEIQISNDSEQNPVENSISMMIDCILKVIELDKDVHVSIRPFLVRFTNFHESTIEIIKEFLFCNSKLGSIEMADNFVNQIYREYFRTDSLNVGWGAYNLSDSQLVSFIERVNAIRSNSKTKRIELGGGINDIKGRHGDLESW